MTADTKEKTRIGGNRAGFISRNLEVNALNEMYQKLKSRARQQIDRKQE